MTIKDEIIASINQLDRDFNKTGIIKWNIDRLRKCNIKRKPLHPFYIPLRASTTYSSFCIRVARDWMQWHSGRMGRMRNLLHESVHCAQYDRIRFFKIKYLNPFSSKFRNQMEQEAYAFVRNIMGN